MPLSLLMPQQIAQLPGQLLTEIVQDTTQGLGNMLTGAQTTTHSMLTQNNNTQGPVERLRLIQCDRHQLHSHVPFVFLVYVGYEKKSTVEQQHTRAWATCSQARKPLHSPCSQTNRKKAQGLGDMLTGAQTTQNLAVAPVPVSIRWCFPVDLHGAGSAGTEPRIAAVGRGSSMCRVGPATAPGMLAAELLTA